MSDISDLDLLMVGKTGNGKSALGNAILKRDVFESESSCESVTTNVNFEFSKYKGLVLKVVDGPGVGDTRMDVPKSVKLFVEAMKYAMLASPRGYHAFLLVVRFGGRFTSEDIDTLKLLKNTFGKEDFVKNYCILVFTCGDSFYSQNRRSKSNQTFDEWCQKQKGVISELLRECDNRYVLFDNMTEDEQKQDAQIDRLLELVNGLQSQGIRYTDDNFKRAQKDRDKAVVASSLPLLQEKAAKETSLILQEMDLIKNKFQDEQQIAPLQELEARCQPLIKRLQEEDKNTGALSQLIESVQGVMQTVSESIESQKTVAEERKVLAEKKRKYEAEMDKKRLEAIKKKEEELKDKLEKQQEKFNEKAEALKTQYRSERNRSGGTCPIL